MEYFSFLLYTIMFIAILTPVAVVIFDFFDIKLAVYGNYLFWFIAMALFNAILPFETKNIFINVDPIPSATGPIGGPAPPKFLTVKKNDIIQGTGFRAQSSKRGVGYLGLSSVSPSVRF